jgi:hypothetical protein
MSLFDITILTLIIFYMVFQKNVSQTMAIPQGKKSFL